MLCLVCHKKVDELEKIYNVETMQGWKAQHTKNISALFSAPNITDEQELLRQINDLLDTNGMIFSEYGPFSPNAINGESGDGLLVWRRRCLDTILPNNQRIIQLIERNKKNFSYPWDTYRQMVLYKMHADAFQDNCLLGQKVNDYKLFPLEFDHFVKKKLGIQVRPLEQRMHEELEYRSGQVRTFIDQFLSTHNFIDGLLELNRATMLVDLRDGRSLKVFVTNTYYFTEYTFDKIMAIDPTINAIICSCPAGTYSDSAKRLSIESGIGLFMLGEFMGAIRNKGEDYLNYLPKSERQYRVASIKQLVKDSKPASGVSVYLFGSYLRRRIYSDIDLMLVYSNSADRSAIQTLESTIKEKLQRKSESLDISVTSSTEFASLKFKHNNLTPIYP